METTPTPNTALSNGPNGPNPSKAFDLEAFAQVTRMGSEIAQLVALVPTRDFGLQLQSMLQEHADSLWPERAASRRAAVAIRVKSNAANNQKILDQYHAQWRRIHTRALAHTAGVDDTAFLDQIARELSSCVVNRCQQNFNAWRAAHPPDFATAEIYFVWTVELHNHVNQTKQPATATMTVEEARAIWGV